MPLLLPDIDFHHIRPYGQPATRPNAFEELASILIEQRDDYLFGFDASAVGQIKKSLTRTLENESTLTKYFVALGL